MASDTKNVNEALTNSGNRSRTSENYLYSLTRFCSFYLDILANQKYYPFGYSGEVPPPKPDVADVQVIMNRYKNMNASFNSQVREDQWRILKGDKEIILTNEEIENFYNSDFY